MRAKILVDASSRQELVTRFLGIRRRRLDTQVAATAVLTSAPGNQPLRDTMTLIEATENGWWYAALIPRGRLIVAWFTDPDLLRESKTWRPDAWWNLLCRGELIADVVRRHGYQKPDLIQFQFAAAGSCLLTRPAGEDWLAVGDAAAAFDPLSSHGIASALASGAAAGKTVGAMLDGDTEASGAYTDRLFADYARYLADRHACYADERRWPTSLFWRRRAAMN